jgi:hypothetical protein
VRSGAENAKDAVASGAENAAEGVATVAQKAKTPLIAGGAALAGLAGAGILAARSNRRRKVLGIPMPKRKGVSVAKLAKLAVPNRNGFAGDAQKIAGAVSDSAKRADEFGQRVSKVARSVQSVSETTEQAAKRM